jgi:hypothetical protein
LPNCQIPNTNYQIPNYHPPPPRQVPAKPQPGTRPPRPSNPQSLRPRCSQKWQIGFVWRGAEIARAYLESRISYLGRPPQRRLQCSQKWQIGFVSHSVHKPGPHRLGHWDFGFVSCFEVRISHLAASGEAGGLALFFTPPSFSAHKRGKLGLFRILSTCLALAVWGIWISGLFRISCFGFRICRVVPGRLGLFVTEATRALRPVARCCLQVARSARRPETGRQTPAPKLGIRPVIHTPFPDPWSLIPN